MLKLFFVLAILFNYSEAVYLDDYEDSDDDQKVVRLEDVKFDLISQGNTTKITKNVDDDDDSEDNENVVRLEDVNFEPIIPENSTRITKSIKEIDCDNFFLYAANCTTGAAGLFDAHRKVPPIPSRIDDWCKAIKYLSDCAFQWNEGCKDVSDSKFSDESISGHMHVINNICEDEKFRESYGFSLPCIESTTNLWESCYLTFKKALESQKNTTMEWTHYVSHFYLCCARAKFRRCTLEFLFTKCSHDEAIVMQKFSTIISEGDVFQFCDYNMMYDKCPGGDPRPTRETLARLKLDEAGNALRSYSSMLKLCHGLIFLCLLFVL